MLFHKIEQNRGPHDAVITPDRSICWSELWERAAALRDEWQSLRGRRLGLAVPSNADALAALAAIDAVQANVTLFDDALSDEGRRGLASSFQWHAWLSPSSQADARWSIVEPGIASDLAGTAPAGVTILTSGTEGTPKPVEHTWQSLFRPVRVSPDTQHARWLLAYRLHLYAGLQVIAQGVASQGCLVIPGAELPVEATLRLLQDSATTHASATPSYWRRLLLFSDPAWWRRLSVRQITIGGEAVDQTLLDQLRTVLPQARIVHIYATTELGRCFSVADGLQGFPLDYLRPDRFPDVRLKIADGELYVQSQNRGSIAQAGPNRLAALPDQHEGWFRTGDLVEIVGDRVLFRGRRGDMINVGGNKVPPLRVEEVIRDVPGVRDCLVQGKASSIAGHLVACQIVIDDDYDAQSVRQNVLQACQKRLHRHEVPRIIDFVDRIEMTSAGKRTRAQN